MSTKKTPAADKTYEIGDIVLAKVKGYPAWPSHVVEPESAPDNVRRSKPPKGKQMYLVQFFPTGDYAWNFPRDLSLLSPEEIKKYIDSGKKNGDLLAGYKTAQNPQAWLDEREEATRQYEELQRQAAMEAAEHEDQLQSDEGGSKRKRGSDKKDDKEDKKKKKKAKLDKLAKSRANGGADEEGEVEAKKSKAAPAEGGAEEPGLKQTKEWRHKLQKVFLSGAKPLNETDVRKCADYFDAMENFKMEKDWLTASKLAKVLKRIALLDEADIPSETEFNFRPRSSALASQWAQLGLNEGTPVPTSAAPPSKSEATSAPNGNGATSEEPKPQEAAQTNGATEAPPAEDDSAPKTEA